MYWDLIHSQKPIEIEIHSTTYRLVFQDTQIYDDAQSRQGICGKWQGICGSNARCKARHTRPFQCVKCGTLWNVVVHCGTLWNHWISLELAWLSYDSYVTTLRDFFVVPQGSFGAFGAFLLWPEGPERSSAKEMFVQSNVLILGTGRTSMASEWRAEWKSAVAKLNVERVANVLRLVKFEFESLLVNWKSYVVPVPEAWAIFTGLQEWSLAGWGALRWKDRTITESLKNTRSISVNLMDISDGRIVQMRIRGTTCLPNKK